MGARQAEQILDWWLGSSDSELPFEVKPEFWFDSGLSVLRRNDWLNSCRSGAGWSSVRRLVVYGDAEYAFVVFEATENVSLLRYRFSWVLRFGDGALRSLIETRSVIPNVPFQEFVLKGESV